MRNLRSLALLAATLSLAGCFSLFPMPGTGGGKSAPAKPEVDGKVFGTYLHGLFGADAFRARFLETLGVAGGVAWDVREAPAPERRDDPAGGGDDASARFSLLELD